MAKTDDQKVIILISDEYKGDPDFVKGILEKAVTDRKLQEEKELEKMNKKQEQEFELEKLKQQEFELKRIKLKQLNVNFTCNFEVLDQAVICENVLPVSEGPWLDKLKDLGVILTDTHICSKPMQVLIGGDIMGRLLTGKRKLLSSGLVAVETHLGWILMGKVLQVNTERVNLAMTVASLFVKEAEISDFWRLDVIGIKDPMEKISKHETDLKTKEHFKGTVKFNQDNRYEVCLPWTDDSSPLPDNFNLAKKRLEVITEKFLSQLEI
ncbi:hypothetical protein AVEN_83014-1 [Araneus ventricosus]|uniref:Peptidase aspartic putative domain-containing protein n=1 Tax=Araneus ventricosus TaxID=182803 RepID=A0A4Y2GKP0_ARAVE|nr:hypothetical protein AVEN_83014-1 [Araneus ventricosus]